MDVLREAQHKAKEVAGPRIRGWIESTIQNSSETLRMYINRYPPLAAFVFTLMVCSAVPVSLFMLFASISTMVTLGVALSGFALVEGVALLASGGVLLATLGCITGVTGFVFFWISLVYVGYRGASSVMRSGLLGTAKSIGQSVYQTAAAPVQSFSQSFQQPSSPTGYRS